MIRKPVFISSEGVAPLCDLSGEEGHLNVFKGYLSALFIMLMVYLSEVRSQQWLFCEVRVVSVDNEGSTGSGGKPSSQNPSASYSRKKISLSV